MDAVEKLLLASSFAVRYGLNVLTSVHTPGRIQVYSSYETADKLKPFVSVLNKKAGLPPENDNGKRFNGKHVFCLGFK